MAKLAWKTTQMLHKNKACYSPSLLLPSFLDLEKVTAPWVNCWLSLAIYYTTISCPYLVSSSSSRNVLKRCPYLRTLNTAFEEAFYILENDCAYYTSMLSLFFQGGFSCALDIKLSSTTMHVQQHVAVAGYLAGGATSKKWQWGKDERGNRWPLSWKHTQIPSS